MLERGSYNQFFSMQAGGVSPLVIYIQDSASKAPGVRSRSVSNSVLITAICPTIDWKHRLIPDVPSPQTNKQRADYLSVPNHFQTLQDPQNKVVTELCYSMPLVYAGPLWFIREIPLLSQQDFVPHMNGLYFVMRCLTFVGLAFFCFSFWLH